MSTSRELPKDYKKAFKDADIRGVYPSEIDEEVTYRVARAFVEQFKLKQVIVARDMRESSPALHDAFVAGARESGANVIDLGMVGTPALYYASGTYKSFGVMITASHNPKEYNGLKLVKKGAVPLTNDSGLLQVLRRVEKRKFKDAPQKGVVKQKKIQREYKKYVQSKIALDVPRNLKIVIDAGNGMASDFEPLLSGLPFDLKKLFFKLDGTFPNRGSNPTLAKNQTAIVAELKTGNYDFGVAFDGDVDRVAFFDEKGRYINSAHVGALLVKYFLLQKKKQKFIYTIFTSRIYEETIRAFAGKAIRARVGHAFIKELMHKHNARFACEHSAHFYFQGNFHADSGILAFLYLSAAYAEVMQEGKSFSQMIKEFQTYHQTEEILVRVPDKKKALTLIAKHYKKQKPLKIEWFDGVSILFEDVWIAVKQSVTEDALKFVVESPEKKRAEDEKKKVHEFLCALS